MHCGACVRKVTQALNSIPGTRAEEVRVGMARIATEADAQQAVSALSAAGFPAHITADHA
jgi:copper chaperone CopZ